MTALLYVALVWVLAAMLYDGLTWLRDHRERRDTQVPRTLDELNAPNRVGAPWLRRVSDRASVPVDWEAIRKLAVRADARARRLPVSDAMRQAILNDRSGT